MRLTRALLTAAVVVTLCAAAHGAAAQTALHGRALALTGGGAVGTAWETGVLLGLQRGGIDVDAADMVIGTSAGSIVGAQLRAGTPVAGLYRAQTTADASILADWSKNVDLAYLAATRPMYYAGHPLTQAERAAVGARALAAKLPDEAAWLPNFYRASGIDTLAGWPARPLDIVAVDANDGSVKIFDAAGNAPITLAIAASAAVPAFTPPITIGTHRYTDGGVAGTNLDVARGYATVLAIVPSANAGTDTEVAALRAAGANVVLIAPDAETKMAMGPNSLDASRKPASAEAGVRQGLAAAAGLKSIWR